MSRNLEQSGRGSQESLNLSYGVTVYFGMVDLLKLNVQNLSPFGTLYISHIHSKEGKRIIFHFVHHRETLTKDGKRPFSIPCVRM